MRINDLKLNILRKGLILLLVPFALQAALFFLLFTQISSAEKFAEEQNVRTDIVEMTTSLVEDFGIAWISIFSHVFGSSKWAQQSTLNPEDYQTRMKKNLAELNALPALPERMKQMYQDAENLCRNQYLILKKVEQGGEPSLENVSAIMTQVYSMKHELANTFTQMNAMKEQLNIERQEIRDALAQDEHRRTKLKQASVVFLAFELLLTGLLLAFFLNDISKRLNELVSNAKKLPEEKNLTNHVAGSDEIAYLDSVLHEASEKLLVAKQNRQSIMNMIAHDIRSPLMSSNLLIDSLARNAQSSGDLQSVETSERLKQTYKEVILLVEDLLSLEKNEAKLSLNPQLLDIDKLCQSAIDGIAPQAQAKSITISNDVKSTKVIADELRILQVLNNLIANAIKFSKHGATITVSSSEKQEQIIISVKDEGMGIEADEIPNLFDKFYQSRNAPPGEGFGLGLAIAKMVVESHDGEIGVTSEPGKGSTFWFSLPLDNL